MKQKFFCDYCGLEVKKDQERCPGCGRYFKSVLCPVCGFSGESSLFSKGCPACGYAGGKRLPRFKTDETNPGDGGKKGRFALSTRAYKILIVLMLAALAVLFFVYVNIPGG